MCGDPFPDKPEGICLTASAIDLHNVEDVSALSATHYNSIYTEPE